MRMRNILISDHYVRDDGEGAMYPTNVAMTMS